MSKTLADHAAAYRARRAAKIARMEAALHAVLAELTGNDKPLAVKLREIVAAALSTPKGTDNG